MDIRFFIDRQTGEPHIAAHGVQVWEAADVLQHPEFDYNGREGTRIAVGQTRTGRYLRVIYRPSVEDNSRFVITAYDLPPKAKAALAAPETQMNNDPNQYPPGLDYEKTAAIARHYDQQSEEQVIAEIEAAVGDSETVLVQVPRSLLADILKLIDSGRKSA